MVAPSIGALMLQYVSWRGIFLAQAILTLPALYGSFRLKEPMTTDHTGTGGILAAIRRYGRLARNGAYMVYTLAFSVMGFSFFAFLAGSSYIYIRSFGMTEQVLQPLFCIQCLCPDAGIAFMRTRVSQLRIAPDPSHLPGGHVFFHRRPADPGKGHARELRAVHVCLFAVFGHEPPHQQPSDPTTGAAGHGHGRHRY